MMRQYAQITELTGRHKRLDIAGEYDPGRSRDIDMEYRSHIIYR